MDQITRIGMDTSKRFFQLHGVDGREQVVLRRQLTRAQMASFFEKLPPTLVAMEACGGAHHWARELTRRGHDVRLIAPQLAKPYVARGKNDAADAAALCEAAGRPHMRFVPAKSEDQQAALMLAGQRERLVGLRTQLVNTIRGHAAEFGVIAARGPAGVGRLLDRLAAADLPALARELFAELAEEHASLCGRIAALDRRLRDWHNASEAARRLTAIPGVGPLIASLLVMKTPDPRLFKSGRDFAAWLGLTPRDHSTAGKARPGRITRAGDPMLRSLLVVGATAVVWQTRRGAAKNPSAWLQALIARKPAKLAAVALANKMARIAWKLMASGERYARRGPAIAAA
ncbi:IS110 family transposase [Methylocystis sp. JAN1]|uniref:IS110 family transposase n=1 Tax=Methylocystis sp. JAN1 TaxID=3397211 RepID=UPI003FA2BFFE